MSKLDLQCLALGGARKATHDEAGPSIGETPLATEFPLPAVADVSAGPARRPSTAPLPALAP